MRERIGRKAADIALSLADAELLFALATTAPGRVETVQASSCLPNSGHSAASGNALAIQIGWRSRPAGCGRDHPV